MVGGAGIGPTRAVTLVQKHGSLEKVLDSLDSSKYPVPDPFPYHEARRLFQGQLARCNYVAPALVLAWHNSCPPDS